MSLLIRCLAGTSQPTTPWSTVPTISLLRRLYVEAAYLGTLEDRDSVATALLSLGQQSECYVICDGLDPTVRNVLPDADRRQYVRPLSDVVARLGDISRYVPSALEELRSLRVPDMHIRFLGPYLTSVNPTDRVAGLVTLLVLATTLLIGLPILVSS